MSKMKRWKAAWLLKRALRKVKKAQKMLVKDGIPLTGYYSAAAAAEKLLEAAWLLGYEDDNGR